MLLADRWHGWPQDYKDRPPIEREYWLDLLGVEAETARDLDGVGPDDDLVDLDDD